MVSDICPLCPVSGDTVLHRIWECIVSELARARARVLLCPKDPNPCKLLDDFKADGGAERAHAVAAATRGVIPDLAPDEMEPHPDVADVSYGGDMPTE